MCYSMDFRLCTMSTRLRRKCMAMLTMMVKSSVSKAENRKVGTSRAVSYTHLDVYKRQDHFTVWLSVAVSPQFFSWVLGFGEEAQILEPQWVLKRLKSHLEKTLALYE